nr:hypothetical protein CPGR_00532 [Mycolicibacterium malmesburyense]
MVHRNHKHVVVITDMEKHCAEWDLYRKVESVPSCRADGVLKPASRPPGGIDEFPTEIRILGRHYLLLRYPLGRGEQRAQALMAVHQIGQCRTQRVGIKSTAQSHRRRHVVHRRRTEQLINEPQPLLGEGQRNDGGAFACHQPWQSTCTHTDLRRQLRNRRRLKYRPNR